ncbi:MAG: diphthamide biosynthesis enzyme Dph2 [Candidatus Diapherotrites archaeon]|uniref:2-(3-amino-3-carboxypropyl)histidine synthase n=1 Tax=Candidatus Iainarchaeum sp. TaxID=3101447 RepID=A0A938YXE9_9ARCH|nr:diphthamide biosynthesis enzyme Dph2 [Candidatus Diapherotrites archaeon]
MLQIDMKSAIATVKSKRAKKVAVQIPEGLKTKLTEIVKEVEEKTGAAVFSFVEPCFGACDLGDAWAKELGAELLLHFGHTQILGQSKIPTVYLPLEYNLEGKKLETALKKLDELLRAGKMKKVALCTTIQYLPCLQELKKALGKKGFSVLIGKGKGAEAGQVLGCNYSAVKSVAGKADAVAFFGDGLFHPLGISFCCKKPVFLLNPIEGRAEQLKEQRDLLLRKRIAMVEKVKQAKTVGIWVSTKRGQQRAKLAMELKKKFEGRGKAAFIFASGLLNPEYLLGVQVEAIVSTACPRIALDDSSSFKQAIVNPNEALIALGERKFEEFEFDELA